jgi:DNA polymerase-1
MRQQFNLFTSISSATNQDAAKWELPNLLSAKRLSFDTETDGVDVWSGSRPVGMSVATEDGYSWYIPWGHDSGFNFDLDIARRWAIDNLSGKDLDAEYTKFDAHMLHAVGIDLEAMGCRLHDVRQHAALIDEQMRDYDLNSLAQKFLGKQKVELAHKDQIKQMSSESVRWYARYDAQLVTELRIAFAPMIERDEITAVAKLEDDLIFSTVAMERNGAPINVEKLTAWEAQARARYQQLVLKIFGIVGFKVIPSKPTDLARLYRHLHLDFVETETGLPSFTNKSLKEAEHLEPVRLAGEARRVKSVAGKLTKMLKALKPDGKLRYNINQLRSSYEQGGVFGTVTGRYSMSDENLEQVFSEEKQIEAIGDMFIIRELFVETEPDHEFLSADASQIEFRIFAHYAEDERLIRSYNEDPDADFHSTTSVMCGIRRKPAKTINFGRSYGMGKFKMRGQMAERGFSAEESDYAYDAWGREFPKGPALLDKAAKLAKKRGYIKTALGRRRRYKPDDTNHYTTAWNAVGQGTAADIMKLVTLDTYNHRKDLGVILRFPVHDELCGGLREGNKEKLREFLDIQRIKLKVPIIWKVKTGESWRL